MPSNIDNRVVRMQFENAQFERNIAKSKRSLADFKKELNFKETAAGLQNVFSKLNSLDLNGLINNVGKLADKFTGIGHISEMVMTQIQGNIRNAIASMSNFVDSMTTAQINAGKAKYELLNKSVQTIKNATGDTEADVYAVMEKLNRYTDQTSYDFAEMAQSIGKFTSVGRGLAESELAMEGIANWAALSGAGIQEANRAMYNLSQSMGIGKVQLMDWKSIENANMATREFKNAVLEAAAASGDLVKTTDKNGNAVYKTAKKYGKQVEVSVNNFNASLQQGWFTSDVLMSVLGRFADTTDELGKKAYEAAQKCTTFTDVLQAWKDQISTGWMNSFRLIFGDLTESMNFFSNVCNKVAEDLDTLIQMRNKILSGWATLGGRDSLFRSILGNYEDSVKVGAYGLLDVIHDVGSVVGDAFKDLLKLFMPGDVIAAGEGEDGLKWYLAYITVELKEFTDRIQDFMKNIRKFFTEDVSIGDKTTTRLEMIRNVLRGIAGAFVFSSNIIGGIIAFFSRIYAQLSPSFLAIENLFSEIGKSIYESAGQENQNKGILGFFTRLADLASPLTGAVNSMVTAIVDLIVTVLRWGRENGVFQRIADGFTKLFDVLSRVSAPVVDFVKTIFEVIADLFDNGLSKDTMKNAGRKIVEAFKTMFKGIADALPESMTFMKNAIYDLFGFWTGGEPRQNIFTMLHDLITNGFDTVRGWFKDGTIDGIWNSLATFFSGGLESVDTGISGVIDWFSNLSLGDAIKGAVSALISVLTWAVNMLTKHNLLGLIKAFFGVMGAVKIYKLIKNAGNTMEAIGSFFKNPLGTLFGGGGDEPSGLSVVVEKIYEVAKAIGIVAAAIVILGAIPTNQLIKGIGALTIAVGLLAGFILFVNHTMQGATLTGSLSFIGIGAMAISIGLVVAALLPLTLVSWEGFAKMMAGLGGVLLQLVGFMQLIKALQIGDVKLAGFFGFAASISLLMLSLLPLAAISWEGYGRIMAGLGGVLLQLIAFMKITKSMGVFTEVHLTSFIGFAGSIALIMMSLLPLASISWEGYARMMAGLAGVMLQIIGFMQLIKTLKMGDVKLAGFLGFAASIALLVLSLTPLANISWEGYAKMMAGLGGVLAQILLFSVLIRNMHLDPLTMSTLVLFAGAMAVAMLSFGIALALAKGMDWGTITAFAAGLSVIMVAMMGVVAGLGSLPIATAVKGIAMLTLGMIAIMGTLSIMMPVLMGSIGGSIQSLAGRLRLIGDMIAQFTTTMNSVGSGEIASARNKLTMIKNLILDLGQFKGLDKIADDFSVAIWALSSGLAIAFKEFSKVGDISNLSALALLKEIQDNYTGIDTLSKMNLSNLQANLAGLGGAMMLYAKGAQEVAKAEGISTDPEASDSAIHAAVGVMKKIAETLVEDGSFQIPEMPSEQALTDWGVQLAALAGALVMFEEAGAGLGAGTDKALETLTFFQELKEKLIETNAQANLNWVQTFMDGVDLTSGVGQPDVMTAFAAHIAGLGEAMLSFAESTTRVNQETGEIEPIDYTKAIDALNAFMAIKEKMPELGGMKQWFTGTKKDLVDLGLEIEALGSSLSTFSNRVSGGEGTPFDPQHVKLAVGALNDMTDCVIQINDKMPRMGSVLEWFKQTFVKQTWSASELGQQFGSLGDGLGDLADGLMKFSTDTKGKKTFDPTSVSTATQTMSDVADAVNTISIKMRRLGSIATAWNNLFGEHQWTMQELGQEFGGLGDGIYKLGQGLATFASKATGEESGFDPESVGNATKSMDEMITFMNGIAGKLPIIGGFGKIIDEFINGHTMTMTELGNNIGQLGDGLGKLGSGLTAGGWGNVKGATLAFETIEGILGVVAKLGELKNMESTSGNAASWMQDLVTVMSSLTSAQMELGDESIVNSLTNFMAQLDMSLEELNPNLAKLDGLRMVAEIIAALSNVNISQDFSVVGAMITKGTAQGIANGESEVITAAVNMAVAAYEAACAALQSHSPSRLFAELGGFVASGMANGITSGTGAVIGASEGMSEGAVNSAAEVIRTMGAMLDQDLDANPTISPVLDLTGFRSGMAVMQKSLSDRSMTIDTSAAGSYAAENMPRSSKQEINQNGSDYSGLYSRIEQAVAQIEQLGNRISGMKLILDSGVVAGGVTDDVDQNIGRKSFYAHRNN